jgi:hypothetical protein
LIRIGGIGVRKFISYYKYACFRFKQKRYERKEARMSANTTDRPSWEDEARKNKEESERRAMALIEERENNRNAIMLFWNKLIEINNQIAPDIRLAHGKSELFLPTGFDREWGFFQFGGPSIGKYESLGPLILCRCDNNITGHLSCGAGIDDIIITLSPLCDSTQPIIKAVNGEIRVIKSTRSYNDIYEHGYNMLFDDEKINHLLRNLCCNKPWDTDIVPPPPVQSPEPPKKTGGCFIATAVYGSESAPDVILLRSYREAVLLPSRIGNLFVVTYYLFSPPLARFIASKPFIRNIVRKTIIQPIVGYCRARMDRR